MLFRFGSIAAADLSGRSMVTRWLVESSSGKSDRVCGAESRDFLISSTCKFVPVKVST